MTSNIAATPTVARLEQEGTTDQNNAAELPCTPCMEFGVVLSTSRPRFRLIGARFTIIEHSSRIP